MKVLGSGSPLMLTVRVKSGGVGVLRDVLCRRRSDAVAAAGMERESRSVGEEDRDVEARHDEMFVIAKVLDDLRRPGAPDQPRELVGPTWLLDPVIRDAASEAVER